MKKISLGYQCCQSCKKVLRKLVQLREYLTEDLHCFVDILESINKVYTISFQQGVDPNHKDVTKEFEKLWIIAMDKFKITMPLKVHIICHHLSDFFTITESCGIISERMNLAEGYPIFLGSHDRKCPNL